MKEMLEKYEEKKNKLDNIKKHLEETTSKISVKEELTDKIVVMKARLEAYENKKEAVTYLTEHVNMKNEMHATKLESVKEGLELVEEENGETEDERYARMISGLSDHTERVENLKKMMQEKTAFLHLTAFFIANQLPLLLL